MSFFALLIVLFYVALLAAAGLLADPTGEQRGSSASSLSSKRGMWPLLSGSKAYLRYVVFELGFAICALVHARLPHPASSGPLPSSSSV